MTENRIRAHLIAVWLMMAALALALAMLGCGGDAPVPGQDPDAVEDQGPDKADDPDEYQGRSGGRLPFGYNERQCQWDACGGPLPDRYVPASDPVR